MDETTYKLHIRKIKGGYRFLLYEIKRHYQLLVASGDGPDKKVIQREGNHYLAMYSKKEEM